MPGGVNVVVFLFLLTNNFNKTDADISPMQVMLPDDFPFSQVNWKERE